MSVRKKIRPAFSTYAAYAAIAALALLQAAASLHAADPFPDRDPDPMPITLADPAFAPMPAPFLDAADLLPSQAPSTASAPAPASFPWTAGALAAAGQASSRGVWSTPAPALPAAAAASRFDTLRAALAKPRDAGEGYYHRGRRVRLLREPGKALIRLRPGAAGDEAWKRLEATPLGRAYAARLTPVGSADEPLRLVDLVPRDAREAVAPEAIDALADSLAAHPSVLFARPVLVDAASGRRLAALDRIAVRFSGGPALPGFRAAEISRSAPDSAVRARLQRVEAACGARAVEEIGEGTWLLELLDAKADPLEAAARAAALPGVLWAEPDFAFPLEKHFTPDDPLFALQQHLRNSGQNFGTPGADVAAEAAWDYTRGDSAITIAVIDDAVETAHPDLRIKAGGRNFFPSTPGTSPDPADPGENHGTAVAGVAAARGNNALGVTGMAPGARVLPLKIAQGAAWATDSRIARAIRYAADTGGADVINNSWGGGSPNNLVSDAIVHASVNGRGGKGSLVIFSAGNSASDYGALFQPLWEFSPPIPSGRYRLGFRYTKDAGGVSGEDLASIDNYAVRSPDGYAVAERQTFAGGVPAGWTARPAGWPAGGAASAWTATGAMHFGGTGDAASLRTPAGLGHGQAAEILSPLRDWNEGEVIQVMLKISSELNGDLFRFRMYDSAGNLAGESGPLSGVPAPPVDSLNYPAFADSAVAVGASNELDFRSGYSQYRAAGSGRTVAFLAPSNGAWSGITTTDRSGAAGFSAADYSIGFGGTSASAPLASGVAALVLSRRPDLSRVQLLDALKGSCEKIGGATYAGGTHREYGHGRLNARRALALVDRPPALAPIGNRSGSEGQRLSIPLSASDPDGDAPRFSGLDLPAGAAVSGSALVWTPGYAQTGNYTVRLVATTPAAPSLAAQALSDTETVVLTIGDVDGPPDIAAISDTAVGETQSLAFPVTATEPDGEPLAWSWLGGPAGASFQNGVFSWTPGYADSGSYDVRFIAVSGALADTEHVRIRVLDRNRHPVLAVPSARTVAEGGLVDFAVTAADPDGDPVFVVALALPSGAGFDGKRFLWRPAYDQAGQHSVRFYAVSGALVDSQDVAITVTEAGSGAGTLRLAGAPGTEFLAMPAGDGPGEPLGRDTVDFRAGVGTYWFTARRAGRRASRFALTVRPDTVLQVPVDLRPHVPWQAGAPAPLSLDRGPMTGWDGGAVSVDLDYDGRQDLVALGTAGLRFLRNVAVSDEAEGDYAASGAFGFLSAAGLHAFTADDWENDGYYDLIVARSDGRVLKVGLRQGAGDAPPMYSDSLLLAERPGKACHPRVADRDGDGLKDLWLLCAEDGLWIYRNVGTGSAPALAAPVEARAEDGSALTGLASPVWMDADGDGRDDLLAFRGGRLMAFPSRTGAGGSFALGSGKAVNVAGSALDCSACRIALRPGADGMAYLLSFAPGRGALAYRTRLLGDFSGDGKVDAADRAMLLGAWETRDTDAGWNPALNLALDPDRFERIDVRDLGAFGDSWGLEE